MKKTEKIRDPRRSAHADRGERERSPSRAVLVVDDEKNIRLTITEALSDMELEAVRATSGEEALARLSERDFALVLLDLRMPGMDGLEVLRRIRIEGSRVPVVIITAHGTSETAVEALQLGAVEVLKKPFSASDFRTLVGRTLRAEEPGYEGRKGYAAYVRLALTAVGERRWETARDHVSDALLLDDARPEAHNLMGVICESQGERLEAQEHYRHALERDPTYAPARANLQKSIDPDRKSGFFLGEAKIDGDHR